METHLKDKKRQRYPYLGMDTQLGRELLHCMVILCWTFWGTVKLFSAVVSIPFYISIAMHKGSNFFMSLPTHFFLSFFFFFLLCYVLFWKVWSGWCLVILICISPVINDAGHVFMCLLAIFFTFFEEISIEVFCQMKNVFY